jgi:hypothetical protein
VDIQYAELIELQGRQQPPTATAGQAKLDFNSNMDTDSITSGRAK